MNVQMNDALSSDFTSACNVLGEAITKALPGGSDRFNSLGPPTATGRGRPRNLSALGRGPGRGRGGYAYDARHQRDHGRGRGRGRGGRGRGRAGRPDGRGHGANLCNGVDTSDLTRSHTNEEHNRLPSAVRQMTHNKREEGKNDHADGQDAWLHV